MDERQSGALTYRDLIIMLAMIAKQNGGHIVISYNDLINCDTEVLGKLEVKSDPDTRDVIISLKYMAPANFNKPQGGLIQ